MIIAFIGDNEPAREQALREYVGKFSGVHGSSAIDRFNGESIELGELKDKIATIPFLSSRRMVIIRDLSQNKNLVDKFEELATDVAETTEMVLIENHIDSRSKYLSQLKAQAEVKEFLHLEGDDLTRWVISQTEKLGGQISFDDANYLVERVGTNHQLLVNELSKLVLFSPTIDQKSIVAMTTQVPQSSVFAMLDAAFNNQTDKALKLYQEQRIQGMDPQAILGMIAWQLHVLAVVKSASESSPQQIAYESKINPFVIRKNLASSKKISKKKLIKMLNNSVESDRLIKTSSTDPDEILQTLLISFK